MSDPPKKLGSLRDRIAAFENKGATTAPAPPAPRPKPAGVSWKPRPRSPPPARSDEPQGSPKAGGMSATDAKASIGQGGSLKERMAALQGLNAFGGSPAPPPRPTAEKPKWKPPPVGSPTEEGDKGEVDKAAVEPEGDTDHKPTVEEAHEEDEKPAQPDPEEEEEEEERERRAAIAARMARLGGARVGMAPPVFGRKPEAKKPEVPKAEVEDQEEKGSKTTSNASPPLVPKVSPPPEKSPSSPEPPPTTSADYFESKDTSRLSPESVSTPLVRSPAMPVPAGPRRAAPPRKRAAKSPSPALAPVLQEGAIQESPSSVPGAPAVPENAVPSAVHAESLGVHGDREPELTGSKVESMLETMHDGTDTGLADETKEAKVDAGSAVVAGSVEAEHGYDTPLPAGEEVHVSVAPDQSPAYSHDAAQVSVAEPTAVSEEHEAWLRGQPEDESEEEEEARRKRIAERLAKSGGVNPLSGPPLVAAVSPPSSPPLTPRVPSSHERRQSSRKDSQGSIGHAAPTVSEKSRSPPPVSPKSDIQQRQGSVRSVRSQVVIESSTQDEIHDVQKHSAVESEPTSSEPISAFTEEEEQIVEEPEPHDYHEAVYEEQDVARQEEMLPEIVDEPAGDNFYRDEPADVEEDDTAPPPPRSHTSASNVNSAPRSPPKRLSVPLPPPPQDEPEPEIIPRDVLLMRHSISPPPPPPLPPKEEELDGQDVHDVPPPIRRDLRPSIREVSGSSGAHDSDPPSEHTVTYIHVEDSEQPVIHSSYAEDNLEDDPHIEQLVEPEYEERERDDDEDDDPIEAIVHPRHEVFPAADDVLEGQAQYAVEAEAEQKQEQEAPPPPPRLTSVERLSRASSLAVPPLRRPSTERSQTLAFPPTVPRVVTQSPRRGKEAFDDTDGDPIDPDFYSPPKSPSVNLQSPSSAASVAVPEAAQAQAHPVDNDAEDPEQARRRTIAERMAKLGGIRFGAPPPPPPVRQAQPPPEASKTEEEAPQERGAEATEPPEEEDEFARKQRIAARIAGMGGMRFGMLPGAAPSVPRAQARPVSPPTREDQPEAPGPPHRMASMAPPPPPPEPSDDDSERIEHEESEAEEVMYEEVEEEAPPPVPPREDRRGSRRESLKPPVPQMSRPPVPHVQTSQYHRPARVGSGSDASASSTFTYPPPPPIRRPSIPTHDTQNDFVMIGEETREEPPPPPPRTVSLKKSHPPSRAAPPPPPPISVAQHSAGPVIPHVDFGGDTDLSLSGQWSEDSTNYPPPPPPTKGEFDQAPARHEVQLTAEDLMAQWGRVGVQIHETASVLHDKSKKTLVGDGSYLGFVTAVLSQVPNAAHPAPQSDNFGYLIYAQTGGSVQRRISDVMPGDVVILQEAKFKGHKGIQSYNQTAGVGEPLYAIVSDYEMKKSKVKVFQANQHVGQQTVETVSYRLEDLKSGSVKIFRVLEA